MAKEKRPVYNGYEERYMTGQEIIDHFSNAYETFGRHHERTTSYKMDWSYKPRVKPEKTYRVFVNDNFCGIFDNDTDQQIYFFGYTLQAPPWAKEGEKPPKAKKCTAYIDKIVKHIIDGELVSIVEQEPFEVICDDQGNIVTDLSLLEFLYYFKFKNRMPPYVTKQALVSMATYKPLTKDDFIGLEGVSSGIYNKYGEKFIDVIKGFVGCDNSSE